MKKEKQRIEVVVTFSEGWQERFTEAAYNLYLRIKEEEYRTQQTA